MPRVLTWSTKIAVFSAALGVALPAMARADGPRPDVLVGLEALRAGRFEEARSRFEQVTVGDPGAPEGPFFQAFHLWWRLLDEPSDADSKSTRLQMEERLREAVARARALATQDEDRARERGLIFTGISLLFDAESKAARGSYFGAASSARQGHRALSQVLALNPASADALFAMGTYNYYADHVSLLVKGLRLFLFIPGGDENKGIEQLETAAQHSPTFGTESLLLLAHIFSGNYAHDYRRALGYLDRVSARHPSSPLLALIHADLLFRLGHVSAAAARAQSALAVVRAGSGYLEEIEDLAAYRLASCALALQDPLDALHQIESRLEIAPPRTSLTRKRWLYLLASAARETGAPGAAERWIERLGLAPDEAESLRRRLRAQGSAQVATSRAAALRALSLGRREEARRQIEELLARFPSDARLSYDLGRLLQMEGRLDEARPHLLTALAHTASPQEDDISGRTLLRLGWDLEQSGRREEAIDLYHRAANLRSFIFREDARDLMDHPAEAQPEG